ncbi:hypothetical protein MUK42_16179 [Musa troglodytarum]|nr:hypothetical protein MUK42_16179 [Musa troglodytarum]
MAIRLITARMQFLGSPPLMIPMKSTRVPRRNQSTAKRRKDWIILTCVEHRSLLHHLPEAPATKAYSANTW